MHLVKGEDEHNAQNFFFGHPPVNLLVKFFTRRNIKNTTKINSSILSPGERR